MLLLQYTARAAIMMSLDLDHVKCDNYLNCVKTELILALERMIDFRLASER